MEYDEGVIFRFIQFALGLYDGREFLNGSAFGGGFNWQAWYDFAKKQSLLGIVFDGIQKLPREVKLGEDLAMTWFGVCRKIKHRNVIMDRASVYIYNRVKEAGYHCCVLKGQGNALLYPNPSSRTPGDVDVWVKANREEVAKLASWLLEKYAKDAAYWGDKGTMGKVSLNHVELSLGKVSVELHSTPAILNNPIYHVRLQKWLARNADLQCSNLVDLPDSHGEIAIPTNAFNVIYQLFHLYHHYFYEGVGLRQIIDYYFVVKTFGDGKSLQADYFSRNDLKRLGLWKFAGAVMFVLHEVLGLSERYMIAPMDDKRGRLLLDEILQGGNFGQYDERYAFGHGAFGHNLQRLFRDGRLIRYYPAEALSEPIFRVWHYFWRKRYKSPNS